MQQNLIVFEDEHVYPKLPDELAFEAQMLPV
jgi:hypothetical protein